MFATWESGGTVPPVLGVIQQLVQRGHLVRLMSDACNQDDAVAVGAEFIPYCRAPSRMDKTAASDLKRDWEVSAQEGFERLRDRIMFGPALAYARDVVAELERRPADLVVSSDMLFGVMAGAQAAGARLAILCPNICLYPLPGVAPFGSGLLPPRDDAERRHAAATLAGKRAMLNHGLPALNAARCELGLPPLADALDQTAAAERILLATSSAFDFPAAQLPANVRYVGPQLDDPPWTEPWVSPWPADDHRPLVLIAFSTTFQDQIGVVQRVVDALADLPVRGIVTLGPALDPGPLKVPANVMLCRTASHRLIMIEAAAVVTHAGHGTVIRALAAGVPMLCLPLGRDQHDNTARIVARGAGLALAPSAPAGVIRDAIRRLLDEPDFRVAAQRIGMAVARDAANSSLIADLEDLGSLTSRCAARSLP